MSVRQLEKQLFVLSSPPSEPNRDIDLADLFERNCLEVTRYPKRITQFTRFHWRIIAKVFSVAILPNLAARSSCKTQIESLVSYRTQDGRKIKTSHITVEGHI